MVPFRRLHGEVDGVRGASATINLPTTLLAIGTCRTDLRPRVSRVIPLRRGMLLATAAVQSVNCRGYDRHDLDLCRPHLAGACICRRFRGADEKLFSPALTVALLARDRVAAVCRRRDGMIGTRHKSNHGTGGARCSEHRLAAVRRHSATGAIARTATNIRTGGRTPLAGMTHAVTLLLILIFSAMRPCAALRGSRPSSVVVAYHMSEWRFVRRSPCARRHDRCADPYLPALNDRRLTWPKSVLGIGQCADRARSETGERSPFAHVIRDDERMAASAQSGNHGRPFAEKDQDEQPVTACVMPGQRRPAAGADFWPVRAMAPSRECSEQRRGVVPHLAPPVPCSTCGACRSCRRRRRRRAATRSRRATPPSNAGERALSSAPTEPTGRWAAGSEEAQIQIASRRIPRAKFENLHGCRRQSMATNGDGYHAPSAPRRSVRINRSDRRAASSVV